jgi:hypothetical protein
MIQTQDMYNDSAVGCKMKRYDTVDQTFKSLVIWFFVVITYEYWDIGIW